MHVDQLCSNKLFTLELVLSSRLGVLGSKDLKVREG